MADHFGRRAYGAITAVQGIPLALCAGLDAGGRLALRRVATTTRWHLVMACAFLLAAIGIANATTPGAPCRLRARACSDGSRHDRRRE